MREFKTLKPFLLQYKRHYILGFICLITVDLAQVIIPQFMRKATDLVASGFFEWKDVLVLCAAMLGTMTLIVAGRLLWRYFIHGSARRIEASMRAKLFEHLLTLSYDFYQNNKIGELMARATNDIGAVRQSISMGLVMMIDGSVMIISILIVIFAQDAGTAALTIIPLLPIALLILFFGKSLGKKFLRAQESYSAMSDTVQETFAGIRVVKSFVKEWWFIKKFADTNDDYRKANMDLVKLFGLFFPLISFLSGATSLIILFAGGIRVVYGLMSAGDLVSLFSYINMLIWPLMGAGFVLNMIQRGAASLGRVNEIMRTKPSISQPLSPQRGIKEAQAVKLCNLSFVYPDGTEALSNISLNLQRGAILGILGKTGAGKSTLIKVLTRLVDPPAGTVFIEGTDVRNWDTRELHSLFGVTLQDSYLFSDSIKNNIAYGLEEMDEELVKEGAVNASLDKDIAEFNEKWDTVIGERGMSLSGGQKQRVAIARALVTKPEILILDDSLSAVDAQTEQSILSALMTERAGKTTIIISHRVSTFRNADNIIVLDNGRIVESGTHKQLSSGSGFYARIAALQQLE